MTGRLETTLAEHTPSRWRSFTNDNWILNCCGTNYGNATRKGKRGDDERAQAAFNTHLAAAVLDLLYTPEAREAVARGLRGADTERLWPLAEASDNIRALWLTDAVRALAALREHLAGEA